MHQSNKRSVIKEQYDQPPRAVGILVLLGQAMETRFQEEYASARKRSWPVGRAVGNKEEEILLTHDTVEPNCR